MNEHPSRLNSLLVVVVAINLILLAALAFDLYDHHHTSKGWYPVGDMQFRTFRADDDRPCIVARRGGAISLWCQPDMPTEGNAAANLRGSV